MRGLRDPWPSSARSGDADAIVLFRGRVGASCYERDFDAADRSTTYYRVTGLSRQQRACWGL